MLDSVSFGKAYHTPTSRALMGIIRGADGKPVLVNIAHPEGLPKGLLGNNGRPNRKAVDSRIFVFEPRKTSPEQAMQMFQRVG